MSQQVAVIFGVTGQDGSYLSELLLEKDYRVVGVQRRSSVNTTIRLKSVLDNDNFTLVEGDVTDPSSVISIMDKYVPQECYNLAAQSHVGTSFEQPSTTFQVNTIGVLNILEAIRNHSCNTKFYQASTSEMFGDNINMDGFQNEDTPLAPNSPYAVSKVAAHHLVSNYRAAYNLHASSGVIFNHESSRRGENFVTRKITLYLAKVACWIKERNGFMSDGIQFGPSLFASSSLRKYWERHDTQDIIKAVGHLHLGNLEARRDWGHAEDYVKAMWLMLQQEKPDDYVIATGETYSVKDFLTGAFQVIGISDWEPFIAIDPRFYRPLDVQYLLGDASKARKILGWQPQISFVNLIQEMVYGDIENA